MTNLLRKTQIVDDANKAATQVLSEYLANNQIEKSVCYFFLRYYPAGPDEFRFSRPARDDFARSPYDLDVVEYSNPPGRGYEQVTVWHGATSMYHVAGTPRDGLSVVLAGHVFEVRNVEGARLLYQFRTGGNKLAPLTFWER